MYTLYIMLLNITYMFIDDACIYVGKKNYLIACYRWNEILTYNFNNKLLNHLTIEWVKKD